MQDYFKQLSSTDPQVILKGIDRIRHLLESDPAEEEFSLILDALTSLFYLDTFDRPDLREVLASAQQTVADMGPRAIPLMLERLHNTDLKAEIIFAQTCGMMDEQALPILIENYHQHKEPIYRAFILYAFGKIKSSAVIKALPLVVEAVKSPSRELEDSAVRALGKICECIQPQAVSPTERDDIFHTLVSKLVHPNDVIRSKAVRSLGKLARVKWTTEEQNQFLRQKVREILGLEEQTTWDFAYLVRREAEEIRQLLN